MVDMNTTVNNIQEPGLNIDPEEVLREYGLDSITQTSAVIQHEDNFITINTTLEPPRIFDIVDVDVSDESTPELSTTSVSTTNASETTADGLFPQLTDQMPLQEESEEKTESTDETTSQPISTELEDIIPLLPKNPPTFEIKDNTSRFSGAAWFAAILDKKVLLAGLGGIGSYVLFCLSRMQPRMIVLFDDDVVESSNLSGQLYSKKMVGMRKVDAMAKLAQDFSMYYSIVAIPHKFEQNSGAEDIMICGFDNMAARKTFFTAWVKHLVDHPCPEKCLFIDGRLNMEEFQVFCIQGNDSYNINRYTKEYLFPDHSALHDICSRKQTTYCSNMIGSVMVNLFTNFVANTLNPTIERELPFKTYYNASMMYFKTES